MRHKPNVVLVNVQDVAWGLLRALGSEDECFGRCSSAFFAEERTALKQKRQKMRLLQQRKITDISLCKDLPEEIPLPLVIGTKVTGEFCVCLRGKND